MQTAAAEMTDTDNDEPRGISCPRCGSRWLGFSFVRDGVKKWGYTKDNGKLRIRVRYCQHCGRQVISHEKLVGKPDED